MTIFDDLVQGITKEVSKVQTRSQEMLQSYNLVNQVKDLERKRTAKLLEIGRLVCDKYQRSADVPDDLLKDKTNEIAGYEHEIGLLQAEIDSLKAAAADPDAPSSKRTESKAGYTPTPGFECPRCSAPANREKSFCAVCGEALRQGDDTVDVEPNIENN
jgi:hypothetical protein